MHVQQMKTASVFHKENWSFIALKNAQDMLVPLGGACQTVCIKTYGECLNKKEKIL